MASVPKQVKYLLEDGNFLNQSLTHSLSPSPQKCLSIVLSFNNYKIINATNLQNTPFEQLSIEILFALILFCVFLNINF